MMNDSPHRPELPAPPRRPLPEGCGCLGFGALIWLDFFILVGVSTTVAGHLTPALVDHGYNVRTGAGVPITLLLALVSAVYPVMWVHRAGRWAIRRLVR